MKTSSIWPTSSHRLPFEVVESILLESSSNQDSKSQLLSLISLSTTFYIILLPSLYSNVKLNTKERFLLFERTIEGNEELGCFVQSLTIATDETLEKSPLEGYDRSIITSKIRNILRICSATDIKDLEQKGQSEREEVELEMKRSISDDDDHKNNSQNLKSLRRCFIKNSPNSNKMLNELSLESSLLFVLPPFGSNSNLRPLPNLNPIKLITSGSNPRPQLNWFLRSSSISISALPFENSIIVPSTSSSTSLTATTTSDFSTSSSSKATSPSVPNSITRRLKVIKLVNVLASPNRILEGSETLSGQIIRASYSRAYGDDDDDNLTLVPEGEIERPQMPRPSGVVQEVKLQSLVKDVLVLLESSATLNESYKAEVSERVNEQNEREEDDVEEKFQGLELILQGPKGWGLEKVESRLQIQNLKGKVEEKDLKRVQICFI